MRFMKLVLGTVLGMVLFFGGAGLLLSGLFDQHPAQAVIGGAMLLVVIGFIVAQLRRSRREVKAFVAECQAKQAAGLRSCHHCRKDFPEAGAATTPKPAWHTAAFVLVSLAPIGLGGLYLWALGVIGDITNADAWLNAWKALVILIFGVGMLAQAIRSSRDSYVRCPTCGRACGSTRQAPRGFAVAAATA